MDIVSTGLSYMDIVNYKQYRFQKYRNRICEKRRASGKVYGSLKFLISIMTENRIMRSMELNMLMETVSKYTLDYYQNTGTVFN
jgi:hypothetical protein